MPDAMIPQEQFFELVGYLKSMSARMKALQENVLTMDKNIDGFSLYVGQRKDSVIDSLSDLKQEVSEAKDSVRFLQKNTLLVIGELKKAVKKEDMERIEKRVDLWNPERLVNREEVKRLLDKY
jgi:hypothetical protein